MYMKTYFNPLVLFTSGSYRIESKHFIFILIILFCSILPFGTSAQIKVTSTNDVGIGTDNPQSKLDVNGAVKISTLDTNAPNNPQTPNGATKMVITDTDGKLSFTDMPTGGVQGSGVPTRLAFWNTNNSLSSNSNLFWDNGNNRLGIGLSSGLNAKLNILSQWNDGYDKAIEFKNPGGWVTTWIKTFNNTSLNSRGLSIGGISNENTDFDHVLTINTYWNQGVGIKTQYPQNVLHITEPGWNGSNKGIRHDYDSNNSVIQQINSQGDLIFRTTSGNMSIGPLSTSIQSLDPSATIHLFGNSGVGSFDALKLEKSGGYGGSIFQQYYNSFSDVGLKILDDVGDTWFNMNRFTNNVGVGLSTSPLRTLDVNGDVRVRDLTTDTPTRLIGADVDGDLNEVTLGNGLSIMDGALTATGTGNVTGTGANNRVAFWTGTNGLSFSNNFVWDNGNGRLGIGTTIPSHQLTTSEDILINNVEIGRGAGSNNTTNIKIGQFSLINNTTGYSNVALGLSGMEANTSGHSNTALGSHSLHNNTIGSLNTAIGRYSLNANTEGSDNIAIGPYNLHNNSIGNRNVSIGASALFNNNGSNNSALGWQALYSNLTGSGNVGIGNRAGFSETGSNKLYIENSNSNQPLIGGDFSQNRVGINTEISQISKTLHVTGDARITSLATSNTPPITSGQERMVITDSNGDLSFTSIPQGGGGTVTSISGNNGIATTPLIITSTGTVGLTGNALSLHNLATPGIVAMTAPGALAARTITAGQGISITNGNGVNGNPTISNIGAQYAQLYTTAHLTNLVLNSTAANIPFTISSANGMQTAPNHSYIEIPQTGFYEISYSVSYKVERDIHGSSIANLNFEVYSDQSPLGYLTQCNSRNFENTNSNLTSVSRSFVVQLVQSAFVQLFYKKTNGTPEEVTFYNPQFSIKRLY